jgi:ATP-dependent DNA ligase
MADTADLIVLGALSACLTCIVSDCDWPGAYFGTGSRGGIMGTFLMGVVDRHTKTFKTVCKARQKSRSAVTCIDREMAQVGNGFDDATLDKLNKTLKMTRIDKVRL